MNKVLRLDLSILLCPSQDVAGEWIAHCLNFDVMSQGRSVSHAREMLQEAIAMTLSHDIVNGRYAARTAAPEESWERFRHVMSTGSRGDVESIDRIATSSVQQGDKTVLVASILQLEVVATMTAVAASSSPVDVHPAQHPLPVWMSVPNSSESMPVCA